MKIYKNNISHEEVYLTIKEHFKSIHEILDDTLGEITSLRYKYKNISIL
jgi:hypothetical protein